MKITLSVIKADIGGYVGHSESHPEIISHAAACLERSGCGPVDQVGRVRDRRFSEFDHCGILLVSSCVSARTCNPPLLILLSLHAACVRVLRISTDFW